MKKISVIICAFNGEKYLDRCMRSVVAQSIGIDNLEIVLVNDASTDNTLEKMKMWEAMYPQNIIVVTYEVNKRLGGARNIALQYCTGEYIGYVDCDDWIEQSMYEKMYQKAKEFSCEVVRCKYSRDRDMKSSLKVPKSGEDKFYKAEDFEIAYPFWQETLEIGKNGMYGSCCSGIYLRTFLLDNNIYFPENLYYEDNFWSQLASLYIKRLYIVDEILYHYYVNNDSITMRRNDKRHLERLNVEILILDELKNRGVYEKCYDIVERDFIIRFYLNTMHILFTRFDTMPDVFPEMKRIILKEFPKYKENSYYQENLNPAGKLLLKLLDSPHTWNCEELGEFGKKYAEIMENSMEDNHV